MEIITGTKLSELCDYSFGDHMGAASIPRPKGGFMKEANMLNQEFISKCKEFEGKIMTLFIDNLRLYARPVITTSESDKQWVLYLHALNDLLAVCEQLPNNKFVIFCSHEDTPIDQFIQIPKNVLGIHAVNAEYFNKKIHPFPYGLQREFQENDHRIKTMADFLLGNINIKPTKLLYINCGLGKERNNSERAYLPHFEQYPWATCRFEKDSKFFPYDKYGDFLCELQDHKFMICPQGHGLDCHRNWETLYLRRVPIMKDHPYFRKLMEGFPVLFVRDWPEVTEQLLKDNELLYQMAQTMDLNKLDLNTLFTSIIEKYKV